MKKVLLTGAALVTLSIASFAIASDAEPQVAGFRTKEEVARARAESPRQVSKAGVMKAKIMGGADNDKPLYGMHIASSAWGGCLEGYDGPAQIGSGDDHVKVRSENFSVPVYSGCYFDGKYFAVHYKENAATIKYRFYDAETWQLEGTPMDYVSTNEDRLPYVLTYDPTTSKIYGCFFKDGTKSWSTTDAQFGYINLDDGFNPVTIIGDMGVRMRGMAAAADGTIYGIAYDGSIYTINKQTADITKISQVTYQSFGGDPTNPGPWTGSESAVIDWDTGMMYLCYSDENWDTCIIKIDPATGQSTMVGNYSYDSGGNCNMFTGLYFKQSLAVQGATPTAVSNLTVQPVGVELQAELSFTMPTLDVEGNELSGTLKYRISNGTDDLGEGEAAAGEQVVTRVAVAERGRVNFVVYAQSGNEESAPVNEFAFVGPDTPQVTSTPVVIADGRKATIRWSEAWAVNGGNLAEPVTYKIVRMPDNVTVAEAATGNTYVDNVESNIKTLYTYQLTPKAGEIEGEPIDSRSVYLGNVFDLPYHDSFESETLFNEYRQIDGNRDMNGWWIDTAKGRAVYSGTGVDANDYLLIGPFDLIGGNLYNFSTTANGHSIIENVAVYVGTDPDDVSSFGTCIVPVSTLNPSVGESNLAGEFTPEADGRYYFAIKACSEANHKNIYVYDVNVSAVPANAPDAPVIVAAIPEANSATLQFKVPEKNLDGSAANATAIRVYRDGELLTEITDGVAAGATLEYKDTKSVSTGLHAYTVSAVNATGEGKAALVELFRGLDIPGKPSDLYLVEDLNTPGLIHLSWTAPERGMRGGYINPADLTYIIDYQTFDGKSAVINGVEGTTYDLQLSDASKQSIIAASVYGSNYAGNSRQTWITASTYYGPAYSLPMRESWPGMSEKSGIWAGQDLFADAGLFESLWDVSDGTISGVKAQDNDGGMLAVSTKVDGRGYRIRSPRVDISNAENPCLIFYYYYTANTKDFTVQIKADAGRYTTLKTLDLAASGTDRWIRQEISLKEFSDTKYIQVAFDATANKAGSEFAFIDNFSIVDFIANDLAVTGFTAPVKANVNEPAEFVVSVRNNGATEVKGSDYTVKLYKNDEMVYETKGKDIASDIAADFLLVDEPSVTDPVSTEYYAEVVFAADEKQDNNTSTHSLVHIVTPVYPRVTDLSAANGEEGVQLTWSDPSASDMPNTPVTESFETYSPFIIENIGEWGLYDGDNAPTVILQQAIGEINYPNIGRAMAWQVFDPMAANIFANAWTPRTGDNMLVSFQACVDGTRNIASEDWLISPELYGKAQTISFYARAAMKTEVTEVVDILYSTTGSNIEDFKTLEEDVAVNYTTDWTEYAFDLPDGARYFAIIHKTYGGIAVLLDDVTYIPAGSTPDKIELQGYNIYRNGEKLNTELVGDAEYIDTEAVAGEEYTYHVTAVWDKGESALSNEAVIKVTSVDAASVTSVKISSKPGVIRVEGAAGNPVAVFSTSGVCIASLKTADTVEIPVPASGVYIVRVANEVVKLVVK